MRQYAETGFVALDLANTWDEYVDPPERLPDVEALRRFCRELGVPFASLAGTSSLGGPPTDSDPPAGPSLAGEPKGEEPSGEGAAGGDGLTTGDLDAVRAVRARLRTVLACPPPERTRALARWADELPVRAKVEDASGAPRVRLTAPDGSPLAERLAVCSVAELLDIAASGDWERLRLCAAGPCRDAFVDRSRPGKRQFCSTRCANRAHAAASRARHR
ncbi:CGNR zinc finger domain-containing protein [Nonomuraea sp. NPDC046802]|uniref:CGNR zinc finger domain-containing protein n=1 Tax=Nonomuraea sp. NPDC046802 TaxID=3154919 RepID=UPI0033ED2A9A